MTVAPVGRAVAGGLVAVTLGGCVYLNTLYNARRLWGEAEAARLEGRDSLAAVRYDSVLAKAARSYREDPGGSWADDALYLAGRAHLRRGDLAAAREALELAVARADAPRVAAASRIHLGAVALLEGDREGAIRLLNEGLREIDDDEIRAEGHLWRARAHLATGLVDAGWWDLDRAAEADPRLGATADLERLVWGIARDDTTRARRGVERLLGDAPSHRRADTVMVLVESAADRWGAGAAAAFLDGADGSPWPPDFRDRVLLKEADLRLRAGDTAGARSVASEVAEGFGVGAVEARLLLARLSLARARTVGEAVETRRVLLPVSRDPAVFEVLEDLRLLELLQRRAERRGRDVALFAAAELARDELGAPDLARALFLRYADAAEPSPWAGKALLAALALTPDRSVDGEDRRLRDRIEALGANPYVRAARTGWFPSARFEGLESELRRQLDRVLADVTVEAAGRDVRIRARADTLPGGGSSRPDPGGPR